MAFLVNVVMIIRKRCTFLNFLFQLNLSTKQNHTKNKNVFVIGELDTHLMTYGRSQDCNAPVMLCKPSEEVYFDFDISRERYIWVKSEIYCLAWLAVGV